MANGDMTTTVPLVGPPQALVGPPEATAPAVPTVGQNIEQGLNKLGQAAQEAARDLGAAAGKAADEAAAKLAPMAESAARSLETTTRDLEIAATTVRLGCADGAASAWDALAAGNFGLAGEAITATAGACGDSLGASLSALIPWFN